MNDDNTELTRWLAGLGLTATDADPETWDPGFEAERRIVHFRLGPFDQLYPRPENFKKHFYHKIYPLEIASWPLVAHTELYDGFCRIKATLDVRFQATVKYALANREFLANINDHIKSAYEGLVRDAIDRGLLRLQDGAWIESGLHDVEKEIATAVNELLMLQNVQCRTFCTLNAAFQQITEDNRLDGRFAQESIYLSVIKKNFGFREKQQQEKLRQEQASESQKLLFKQAQLQQLNQEDEIERLKAMRKAESYQLILKDQEKLQSQQFEIEKRLHEEKIKHEQTLKEMEWLLGHQLEENLQTKKLLAEKQSHQEQLAHDIHLKQQALAVEISGYEKQQASWNEVKERMHIENLEQKRRLSELDLEAELRIQATQQQEREKMLEKLLVEKVNNEARMKDVELTAQIEERQKRFEATQNTEEHLRREIELLILEKQRAELSNQVKKAENKGP